MNSYIGLLEQKVVLMILAGLVCNNYGDDTCINPCRGSDSENTWAKRRADLNKKKNNKTIKQNEEMLTKILNSKYLLL